MQACGRQGSLPSWEVVELEFEHRDPSSGGHGLTIRRSYHTLYFPHSTCDFVCVSCNKEVIAILVFQMRNWNSKKHSPKVTQPSLLTEWFDLAFQKALFWAWRRRSPGLGWGWGVVCLHMGVLGAVEACGLQP